MRNGKGFLSLFRDSVPETFIKLIHRSTPFLDISQCFGKDR